MLSKLIAGSRYVVLLAVICIALAAVAVFVYGAALTVQVMLRPLREGAGGASTKALMLGAIELVDLFLLGTTLYVVAIGLYELFIDERLPSPSWLVVRSLDDLKAKILGVVIVILVVIFLGHVVAWDGGNDVLWVGAAIAMVIGATTLFLGKHPDKPGSGQDTASPGH